MPACPNGARPKPGYTATNLVLDASKTVLSDVIGAVTGIWGEIAVQPLLGRVNVDNLCALNLDDPGPPTNDDLVALTAMLAPFGSFQTATNVPTWFFEQVQYQAFVDTCECITPTETIPPRQIVSIPPWAEPWPTDPNKQPQIDRIEHNQQLAVDAMQQLYNGIQRATAFAGDLRYRSIQSDITSSWGPAFQMSGEGRRPMDYASFPGGNATMDVLGVLVEITSLPTKYKVQGTLTPRYYGIGHLTFNGDASPARTPAIARRHSLHYLREFVQAPPHAKSWEVRWHLQPGAVATGRQVFRWPDFTMYADGAPYASAFTPIGSDVMPGDWYDPPLYDGAAARARQFALGGVP